MTELWTSDEPTPDCANCLRGMHRICPGLK